MCGRFTLKNKKAVKKLYNIDIASSYNIAPSQKILMFSGIKLDYISMVIFSKLVEITYEPI